MALKEHPFVVTSSFTADGDTITYDKNAENRSAAVGKAFKVNADGKAELVADGDEIVGKVLAVDEDNVITGAYICGGLRLPLGDSVTVARGDKLVGALGADSAKGFVKAVAAAPEAVSITDTDYTTTNFANFAEASEAVDSVVDELTSTATAVNALGEIVNKGRGLVVDFDEIDALVALI
ncbi:MAG: hypothetical protein OXI67_09835 [Candidatus Poribacteria bacterium]|nr:hypothetical protein [Candidatus Poribacteria bacterium]